MLTKNQILDVIKRTLAAYKTSILDKQYATKKYVDDNRVAYVKSETECVSIDTSTMKDSFVNNSYTYQQDAVSYLEEGIEYHVEVNGVRYRCLCINNIPGKDIVYETIYVQGDDFSLTINNKLGYSNNKYSEDVTKSSLTIELSDTLLQNPPVIKVIKMDIEYMPTYLMPKDLGILNSLGMNRIGKIGTGSVSLGYNNVANNDFSTALGVSTSATAIATLAHGGYCEASANYSHAEGYKTESSGMYSHAEGIMTLANGQGAHAEGFYTVASGQRSHAEGSYTLASSQYQHVEGKFNVEDKANKYAHIVGNGTSKTARKNAYTLDWSGNAWYAGKLSQEGTPTEDKDLTNKKYVDDRVAGLVNSAPETLDTLKELSTALGDDPNFATTMTTALGNKVDKVDGKTLSTNDLTNALKANYDAAYAHSQSAHAPVNAQKNSDITKAEIEAKLTGNITTHTHSQYLTTHQSLDGYAKTADLATVATSGSYNDLTNKPTIPSIDGLATTNYVDSKVAGIVNSAPETLDTLNELATALGNDANFATTVSNQIGSKVDKVNGKGLSTNDLTNELKTNYDAAYTHSTSVHAPSNAQKNSDITKSEIEAKLTGNITTHTHSQYLTSIPSEYITEQELTSKGYITEAVLTSKGYATESQINSAVEAAATTHEEVKTTVNQILGGAYIE